jgi:hypothetical protein
MTALLAVRLSSCYTRQREEERHSWCFWHLKKFAQLFTRPERPGVQCETSRPRRSLVTPRRLNYTIFSYIAQTAHLGI